MKKVISYLMIGICCFMLCGCTKYPNMKQEDYDLVAEYAAGLLLKYSESSDNRLMSIDEANRFPFIHQLSKKVLFHERHFLFP